MGIVGAGRAATLHAEAVRAVRGARLAGISATSADSPRAKALAAALGCPVLSLAELAEACDVVVIATPPHTRAEPAAALAGSSRLRAVLVESPAATTLDGVARLGAALAPLPVIAGVNLLHAPAVRLMLDAVASMDPHHLELRLAVPDPARRRHFGGGVSVDPAAGFWPVLLAAMSAPVEWVAAPQMDLITGLDHRALIRLAAADGRRAGANLRWGAPLAEAAFEAADATRVASVTIWPTPAAELDGKPAGPRAEAPNPVAGLGFVAQIERLIRVGNAEARPWPDLSAASGALTVALAAALSRQRGGERVAASDVPRDRSPAEILASRAV